MEHLVLLSNICSLGLAHKLIEHLTEIGRSIQISVLESVAIVLNDLFNAIDSRIKYITVKSEAMRGPLIKSINLPTKPVQIDHLVGVVELENISYILNNRQVLILLSIHVMKRASTRGLPI